MTTIQASTLPPLQPLFILRGHEAQVHSVHFLRDNTRLLSGDADGFVVLWDMVSKRARVVWRAHQKPVLALGAWVEDKVVSHGRDGTLKVWQLRPSEEDAFSTALPVEGKTEHRREPWLLHSLHVNNLNFCAFSMCNLPSSTSSSAPESILVAVPGIKEGHVDIFSLPTERRIHSISPAEEGKTGMVMALRILFVESSLYLIVGTESGSTSVQKWSSISNQWETTFISKPHTQPVLSLDAASATSNLATASASEVRYFTSSADALITLNPIQKLNDNKPLRISQTKHSGQQSLSVRCDGKIFATGGWDGRVRIYSAKSLKELAVLKWHKDGIYGVAFAYILPVPLDVMTRSTPMTQSEDALEKEAEETTVSSLLVEQSVMSTGSSIVREKRESRVKEIHWLAAGSKDGRISLWEVY